MAQAVANVFRFTGSECRFMKISQKHVSNLGNKQISLNEVSSHDTPDDCWVVVYDRVYDLTSFLFEHAGGDDVLLEHAGRDASLAFRDAGHGPKTIQKLEKYKIGELPVDEKLFRKPGGFKLSDIGD